MGTRVGVMIGRRIVWSWGARRLRGVIAGLWSGSEMREDGGNERRDAVLYLIGGGKDFARRVGGGRKMGSGGELVCPFRGALCCLEPWLYIIWRAL